MRAAFLKLCLVALDRQTAAPGSFEVVIADDASEVDLASVIAPMGLRRQPSIVRTGDRPVGVAAAYNAAIDRAVGRVVLLTTDDSLLAPDAVAAHLAAHRDRARPTYVCGLERQYLFGVLFRDIITGRLHDPGDLAVRTFGSLLGVTDLRWTAEQLGLTEWTITPDDVRHRFADLCRTAVLTPTFRDMYDDLASGRNDLRWLSVRMGNHSIRRSVLVDIGGLDPDLPGSNSDQDLGLRLEKHGVDIVHDPRPTSVLIEHRRALRSFADGTGLLRLAERWPRDDVRRLDEYFSHGYDRRLADYRRLLAGLRQDG
jgi:glycosyltransferase involved in cell wall biosynthesis